MAESNFQGLRINLVATLDDQEEQVTLEINEEFLNSPQYADLLYVLFNLNAPLGLTKNKARILKLKAVKFCFIDNVLYCKDSGCLLLKFLLKNDADKIMHDFHEGDCGGHLYWRTTANKFLRARFYWPTFFFMFIRKSNLP